MDMRRELVLWEGCAYALDGIGAPSRLSVIRKAAALARSSIVVSFKLDEIPKYDDAFIIANKARAGCK